MRVRTIKDSEIAPVAAILTLEPFDVLTHDHRLLFVAVGGLQLQPFTMLILRENVFRYLPFIPPDERVGSLNDQLRRAIVLFQFEEFCIFIQTLEVQDIIDIGTSEGIDALGIIAHHTHHLALLRQLIHYRLLGKVRILILIYQHKMEFINVFLTDVLMILEQHPRLNQQIVEVHRIRLTASLRVPYIYIRELGALLGSIILRPSTFDIRLGQHQMILGHRDTISNGRRLIHLVIQIHLLDDGLHQRTGIRLVIDGKVGVIAYLRCFSPQDSGKHAVEGSHLQIPGPLLAYQSAYTLLHLASGLIGKRQRQNLPRSHTLLQKPRNLISQHTRLA